jgi:hypothetical protein
MPDGRKINVRNGFIRNISGGESQEGYEEEEDEEELAFCRCLVHRSKKETISSTLRLQLALDRMVNARNVAGW